MLLPLLCFGPMVLAPFVWLAGRKNDRIRDLLAAVICALALGGCLTLLSGEVRFSIDGFCGSRQPAGAGPGRRNRRC